ncbi:hypothetical protein [Bradyrhizobium sp. AT1]|uniref:hypothetical protein n=1 Tax=Bradyrhizobium sp. AT1 TaxID=574934 RepID=UPI000A4F4990|nr:hypothetical protein [Bradyrhizobium sp. AT1]
MSTRTLACVVAWIVALLQGTRNVELLTEKYLRVARDCGPQAKPSAVSASRMTDVATDNRSGRGRHAP